MVSIHRLSCGLFLSSATSGPQNSVVGPPELVRSAGPWSQSPPTEPLYETHLCLFFFFFSDVDHFLKKSLLNLFQYCFCFMFWLFDPEAGGISAPWIWISVRSRPGIKLATPASVGKILNTGPPGKSLCVCLLNLLP